MVGGQRVGGSEIRGAGWVEPLGVARRPLAFDEEIEGLRD